MIDMRHELCVSWDKIPRGAYFIQLYDGKIITLGIKTSRSRYLSIKDRAIYGFADNKIPGPEYKHFFRCADPYQLVQRELDYFYYNAPEKLRESFLKAFPDYRDLHDIIGAMYDESWREVMQYVELIEDFNTDPKSSCSEDK